MLACTQKQLHVVQVELPLALVAATAVMLSQVILAGLVLAVLL